MLRLTVHHDRSVKRFPMPDSAAVLGSSTACDLVAPYPGVSRRHASLRPLDGGLLVTDLGSKNGLVKDGARIPEVLLRPRDRVRLGRAWLELEEVDSSDAAIGLKLSVPAAHTCRSDSSDTGQLTDAPSAGSPTSVLGVVRAVERAGGIDPKRADAARELLELARAALDARSLWIWSDVGQELPAILAAAGILPAEEALLPLAAAARSAGEDSGPDSSTGPRGALVSPLAAQGAGLVAELRDERSRVPSWKLDLFDYISAKVRTSPRIPRPRTGAAPASEELLHFPEEFVRGESEAMRKLVTALATAAQSRLDVLLLGETGTGKELVAKAIHMSGPTRDGPFVAINCAAIPADLLEAQLFGVEARVATGVDPRPGLFLKADGGSIFLDEIGDLPEPLQAKLLRAIQEREILPLGATKPRKIDVRVISASNKNLDELTHQGRFRADLFYRLRGLQFHMPPLRERREDLTSLVLAFAQRAAHQYGKAIQGVTRKALALLQSYDWPGNIRELKNEVERAVLLCPDGGALECTHFAPVSWIVSQRGSNAIQPTEACEFFPAPQQAVTETGSAAGPFGTQAALQDQLDEVERRLISKALGQTSGNKTRAAANLGITRNGLAIKMKRLGL